MSTNEPGIPIPKSPYYCAKCDSYHTPNPVEIPATEANLNLLRGTVQGIIECCLTINRELATLKDTVRNLINEHDRRIRALERQQKDRKKL